MKDLDQYSELTDISFDAEGAHLAICHKAQGGSANGWHDSVLLKSSEVLNAEVIKAMKDIGVNTTELESVLKANTSTSPEGGIFQQDLRSLLCQAVCDQEFVDQYECIWVCDWNDDTVIFCTDDGMYSVGYVINGVEVDIEGEAKPVVRITDYVEVNGEMLLSEEFAEKLYEATHSTVEKSVVQMIEKATMHPDIQALLLKASTKGMSASDFAYTPDKDKRSTWKLNISDARHTAAAVAALGKGFRGKKVQIPSDDLAGVKRKVRAAYKKFFPDNELPDILKSVMPLSTANEPVATAQIQKYNTENTTGDLTVELEELMKSTEFQDLLKAQVAAATAAKDAELQKASNEIAVLKAAEEKRKEANLVSFAKAMSGFLDEEAQTELVKAMMAVDDKEAPAVLVLTKALDKANGALEVLKKSMTVEVGRNGEQAEVDVNKADKDALAALIAENYGVK